MTAEPDIRMIVDAAAFASRAHASQRRDDGKTPYFNHVAEVAAACAAHEPVDAVLVCACYLHDTIEDTDVTEAALRARFGDAVTDLVLDVTDPPGLKGKTRRQRQVEHTRAGSERMKRLKIADKTSNVLELVEHPGRRETTRGMAKYLRWAIDVVDVARGVDPALEAAFDTAARRLADIIEARRESDDRNGKGKSARKGRKA